MPRKSRPPFRARTGCQRRLARAPRWRTCERRRRSVAGVSSTTTTATTSSFTEHATPESFLAERIVPALNTQVDSIFYCTGVTTLYDHDTDVAERSDDLHEAMEFKETPPINRHANMHMLRKAGVDSLSLVVRRVHEAGLEVFWTHRINDIHDSFTDWLLSRWKREHPQYLMGTPDDMRRHEISHPRYMWSTLDFEKPEVLDYLYRITEEVCRRYDVDGIEIDYFRHPLFFRPNLEYQPATREQVEILTAFQRRIREMAYREGNRRGRPILVAAHVPLSVEKCLHVGIDVERWLREDLLDVLVVGSGYQPLSMPMKKIVELGHAHGVPVYPNISNSGMEQWGGRLEAWRGGRLQCVARRRRRHQPFQLVSRSPERSRFHDTRRSADARRARQGLWHRQYAGILRVPGAGRRAVADPARRAGLLPTSPERSICPSATISRQRTRRAI